MPDSESARGVLSRASLIFGFGWLPDHFGFGVNSPASRTLSLSHGKFLAPIVLHYWSELDPIHIGSKYWIHIGDNTIGSVKVARGPVPCGRGQSKSTDAPNS